MDISCWSFFFLFLFFERVLLYSPIPPQIPDFPGSALLGLR